MILYLLTLQNKKMIDIEFSNRRRERRTRFTKPPKNSSQMKQTQNPFDELRDYLEDVLSTTRKIEKELRELKISSPNYTRSEAAEVLGVSLPTIDRLISSQKITKIKIGSKTLVPRNQIDQLAAGDETFNNVINLKQ